MQDIYKVETHSLALSENMITGDKYRITFLTEGLIRLEYLRTAPRRWCFLGIFQKRTIV